MIAMDLDIFTALSKPLLRLCPCICRSKKGPHNCEGHFAGLIGLEENQYVMQLPDGLGIS